MTYTVDKCIKPPKLYWTAVYVKCNLYSILFNKCQQLTLVIH